MIDAADLFGLVAEWGKPRVVGSRILVPTFGMYPSNAAVLVYVEGGRDNFIVSDGGGAVKTIHGAGGIEVDSQRILTDFTKGSEIAIDRSGWLYLNNVKRHGVTSAISLISEASRDAAYLLTKRFRVSPLSDFRRELDVILESRFRNVLGRRGHLTGATNKIYTFDYLIKANDNKLVAIDAVVPESSSINAAVVSHMDVQATHRKDVTQFIVYDDEHEWKSSDLALLRIGAPAVAFSRFQPILEALRA